MKISDLRIFDPANYLHDDEARAIFLTEALATDCDDPRYYTEALAAVAHSLGMDALGRPDIFKAIHEEGPHLFGLRQLLGALGVEMTFRAKTPGG